MPSTMRTVLNLDDLTSNPNFQPGEFAYIENEAEQGLYVFSKDHQWKKIDTMPELNLNLYDLNKSIINQLNSLTPEELEEKKKIIKEYHNNTTNKFHMLLCKDYNYYTIFSYDPLIYNQNFSDTVYNIITRLGPIYSIDFTNDGALEIWIKPEGEDNPYVFYLFPYDAGVVYYG